MKLQAWYVHDGPTIVSTAAELDAVLDDVAGSRDGDMIELSDAANPMSAGILMVGFEATRGVGIAFWTADENGHISTNGTAAAGKPAAVYFYQDNEREFPANAEVPLADVRRAAHEFLTSGQRPTSVDWQLDA